MKKKMTKTKSVRKVSRPAKAQRTVHVNKGIFERNPKLKQLLALFGASAVAAIYIVSH